MSSLPKDSLTPLQAFREVVRRLGSQSSYARRFGVTQQAVSRRLEAGKEIWDRHVLEAERATGISRHDLRPDLYPREQVSHVPLVGRLPAEAPCDRRGDLQLGEPAR